MSRPERHRQGMQRASRAGRGAAAARDRRARWLPPVIIIVAVIAAFASGLGGAFVLDDMGHIVEATQIRDLWSSFGGSRPVVRFTFGVNYALGGLDTRGYHAFNIAVHVLAALALFGVVRRTLARVDRPAYVARAASWLAMTVALLWSVHPLQTQSVTYVIQRAEAMMGLFYLLTLYAFIRGATARRGVAWFLASIGACALGMGSKEVMVTAPVMVFLYDVVFIGRSFGRVMRRRWVVHAGLFATWGVLVLTGILSVFDPTAGTEVGFGLEGLTWLEYARTQPEVILHYVHVSAWPRHLCLDYMWPVQERWGVTAAAAIVLAVPALATVLLLARGRAAGYVGAWFYVILAPTSSIVPLRDIAFEHRMYLPLAALVVAAVLGADAIARFAARRSGASEGARRAASAGLVVLVASALAVRTGLRNRDYQSPLRAWQAVVGQRPENDRAHQNLGSALLAERRIDEAERHCRRAVELNPANANAYVNLGTINMQRGRFAEAVARYEAAVRADPGNAIAYNNLGSLYATRGDMGGAYEAYAEAVRLEPHYVQARFSLGRVLELRGDRAGALREYRAVLELDPAHEGALDRVSALSG